MKYIGGGEQNKSYNISVIKMDNSSNLLINLIKSPVEQLFNRKRRSSCKYAALSKKFKIKSNNLRFVLIWCDAARAV